MSKLVALAAYPLFLAAILSVFAWRGRPEEVDYPSAITWLDRELEIGEAMRLSTASSRAVLALSWGRPLDSIFRRAEAVNRWLLEGMDSGPAARAVWQRNLMIANLVVIQFESGRATEASALIQDLKNAKAAEVLRFAYRESDELPVRTDLDFLFPTESARQVVELRLSERAGDTATADSLRTEILSRATARARPLLAWRVTLGVLVIVGLVALVAAPIGRPVAESIEIVPKSIFAGHTAFSLGMAIWIASSMLVEGFDLGGAKMAIGANVAVIVVAVVVLRSRCFVVNDTTNVVREATVRSRWNARWLPTSLSLIVLDALGQNALALSLAALNLGSHSIETFDEYWIGASSLGVVLQMTVIGVVGPTAEELNFRAILQSTLLRGFTPPVAILVSSTVFAASHGFVSPAQAAGLLWLGLVLGFGYWRWGMITPIVVCHCVHNLAPAIESLLKYRLPGD